MEEQNKEPFELPAKVGNSTASLIGNTHSFAQSPQKLVCAGSQKQVSPTSPTPLLLVEKEEDKVEVVEVVEVVELVDEDEGVEVVEMVEMVEMVEKEQWRRIEGDGYVEVVKQKTHATAQLKTQAFSTSRNISGKQYERPKHRRKPGTPLRKEESSDSCAGLSSSGESSNSEGEDSDSESSNESQSSSSEEEDEEEEEEEEDTQFRCQNKKNTKMMQCFLEIARRMKAAGQASHKIKHYQTVLLFLTSTKEKVTNPIQYSKGKHKVVGIGKGLAEKMKEFLDTGTVAKLEELRGNARGGSSDNNAVSSSDGKPSVRLSRSGRLLHPTREARVAVSALRQAGKRRQAQGFTSSSSSSSSSSDARQRNPKKRKNKHRAKQEDNEEEEEGDRDDEEEEEDGDDKGERRMKKRRRKNDKRKKSKKEKKKKKKKKIKKHSHKFVEKVLGKDARAALPGHDCPECASFWGGTGMPAEIGQQFCNKHSRHRAQFKLPSTPENYWALSMKSHASLADSVASSQSQMDYLTSQDASNESPRSSLTPG